MVAVIPVEVYERPIAEREARFQMLGRIRGCLPEVPPEEVEQDVAEAIAAIRATHKEEDSDQRRQNGNS